MSRRDLEGIERHRDELEDLAESDLPVSEIAEELIELADNQEDEFE